MDALTMQSKDGLEPRLDRLETRVSEIDRELLLVKTQQEALKGQQDRIMSHIESETAAARGDVNEMRKKLLGDEQSQYSGMLGEIRKDTHEVIGWFRTLSFLLKLTTGVITLATFIIGVVYFVSWWVGSGGLPK